MSTHRFFPSWPGAWLAARCELDGRALVWSTCYLSPSLSLGDGRAWGQCVRWGWVTCSLWSSGSLGSVPCGGGGGGAGGGRGLGFGTQADHTGSWILDQRFTGGSPGFHTEALLGVAGVFSSRVGTGCWGDGCCDRSSVRVPLENGSVSSFPLDSVPRAPPVAEATAPRCTQEGAVLLGLSAPGPGAGGSGPPAGASPC